VRHLGGAVQLQDIPIGIVARDGATGLERDTRMPADGEIELDHRMGGPEGVLHVAVALLDDHRLGCEPRREFAGRRVGRHQRRQLVERDRNLLGRILRLIGIFGEHRRDRLAHIANPIVRQDRLPIGARASRRGRRGNRSAQISEIAAGPDRHHTGRREGFGDLDRANAGMRGGRAHHPHMQLMRNETSAANSPRPRTSGSSSSRVTLAPMILGDC